MLNFDLPRFNQWNFQDPATPLMEDLDLHHNTFFTLTLILGLVMYLLFSIVKDSTLTCSSLKPSVPLLPVHTVHRSKYLITRSLNILPQRQYWTIPKCHLSTSISLPISDTVNTQTIILRLNYIKS